MRSYLYNYIYIGCNIRPHHYRWKMFYSRKADCVAGCMPRKDMVSPAWLCVDSVYPPLLCLLIRYVYIDVPYVYEVQFNKLHFCMWAQAARVWCCLHSHTAGVNAMWEGWQQCRAPLLSRNNSEMDVEELLANKWSTCMYHIVLLIIYYATTTNNSLTDTRKHLVHPFQYAPAHAKFSNPLFLIHGCSTTGGCRVQIIRMTS